jgi:hypothetical protein
MVILFEFFGELLITDSNYLRPRNTVQNCFSPSQNFLTGISHESEGLFSIFFFYLRVTRVCDWVYLTGDEGRFQHHYFEFLDIYSVFNDRCKVNSA